MNTIRVQISAYGSTVNQGLQIDRFRRYVTCYKIYKCKLSKPKVIKRICCLQARILYSTFQ